MNLFAKRWTTFLDQQHRYPTGLVGQWIGERMLRQHAPETDWTVAQLQLQPQDHLLEIGFGAGRGLALAAQSTAAGYVTGVDLSMTMVAAARLRNQTTIQSGRVRLVQGDVAALPFGDTQFDKIFSIHTFYFWPDPVQRFAELIRLLKADGRLMITLSTGHTAPDGERVYTPLHADLTDRIVPALQQLGVRSVKLESGPDSRQYNNVAVMVDK